MVVSLYRTTDDQRTIHRSKTLLSTLSDVRTKGPVDTQAPSLIITAYAVDVDDANYMYISDYNRYYFITKTPQPGGVVEINGTVDVLALPGIDNVEGILAKSTDYGDEYINDGDYVCESRDNLWVYPINNGAGNPDGFSSDRTVYLMCAGGGGDSNA